MAKELKIWNGRGHGKFSKGHIYVAAYSQKQAAELISIACFGQEHPDRVSTSEVKNYYHKGAWGNTMDGITPTEPCVYVSEKYPETVPVRVV